MTSCCTFSRWTETYLDGELSPEHTVDFENHLASCTVCCTKLKFERAVRFSTQRAVRNASGPSVDFQARVRAAMLAAKQETVSVATQAAPAATVTPMVPLTPIPTEVHHRPLGWRSIAPLSIAAAAALAFAAMRGEPTEGKAVNLASATGSTDTMQTVQAFLDQLAGDSEHNLSQNGWQPPYRIPGIPSTADSINVVRGQRFSPPRLENAGAFWDGYHTAQVPVQGRVSSWHYRVGNHRVLLWVYDSKKLPLRAVLEPQVAHNRPIFVGTHRGRAIAAIEKDGFGYAATSNLPQAQAAELVASLGDSVAHR